MNRNALWARVLCDELKASGVQHAIVCPGSRSAPLALALRAAGLRIDVVHDERGAGLMAVAAGKVTATPSVVLSTSGTAVANLLPAAIEADQSHAPLLLLTADRPHELRDVGANQAILQPGLFGHHIRWAVDLPEPELRGPSLRHLRQTACRAVALAHDGPVHLNQPLREPLAPLPDETARLTALADASPELVKGRGGPWTAHHRGAPSLAAADVLAIAKRLVGPGAILVGPRHRQDALPRLIKRLAQRLHAPVLADVLSGCRDGAVTTHDALLSVPDVRDALRPAWTIRFGATPTSKATRQWLEAHDAFHVVVDPAGRGWDDTHRASALVHADEEAFARALLGAAPPKQETWASRWAELDAAARRVHDAGTALWEGSLARAIGAMDALVWTASSLPVRDLERYGGAVRGRILAHRGASGIDGTLHSAAGAALAHDGKTVALVGDQAFLHDLGGLAAVRRARELTLFVVQNGGGRIFEHLPLAGALSENPDAFRDLFLAPTEVDVEAAAAAFDLPYTRLSSLADVATASGIVEVPVDGADGVARRRDLLAQVANIAATH